MDKETEKFYEQSLDMTTHPGWSHFVKYMEDTIESLKDQVVAIEEANTFFTTKGQIQMALAVANYEAWLRNSLEAIRLQDEADAEEGLISL